jgi:hypothetical protein
VPTPSSAPWRDAEGTPISLQSWVEQVVVDKNHGALKERLGLRGEVTGLGTHMIYVRFEQGGQLIALRPHHVRVIEAPAG